MKIRSHAMSALVVLVLSSLGLSACSSASGNSSAAAVDGESRVVVDVEGTEVVVPEHPERVVALSEPTLDGLLALGVRPAGTVTGRGQGTVANYLQEQAGDLELLGAVAQPNFEAIGAANPDLILVDATSINNNPPIIAALREIAPVVFTGYAGGDWRENFALTAEAMNMEEQGQHVLDAYDEKAAQLKDALHEYRDSTFSVVRWQGNSPALILKDLPAGRALDDLDLARPSNQDREGRGHSEPVSLENLSDIDADYIFFGTLGGSSVDNPETGGAADVDDAIKSIQEAQKVPGFTDLKAFQANRIIPVDGSAWTSTGGPLLMHKILDDINAALV
ncbi:ABC transporter substrate-binding protein [Corynebacterium propinquum]|uniref:Iron-siderophore ABC transporter substrate-binding protein n=2 Tax=Corynebacterium propinquum TaxID=43769 RepID=A0AAP4BRK6_9CORY|nr:iron-siderophore ABC transporter substrate-binding protein [Corynebacterium propinquum]MDK4325080.1 iron-siderophore ABC transporter substrate-binding protein [Corynebacterium propinquum]MDK8665979.1 iron-siderophore ABC transporter substrate-binding protein [Corynebacterium propinquum]UQV60532.1 iron-siderophore ABC transporter substrate-binding protein [Corynebacterium propinquum]